MSCEAFLELILTAPSPEAPMQTRESVKAIAGEGLESDRYFTGIGTFSPSEPKPDYEITLIEAEQVETFAAQQGIEFTVYDARRNLVTRGIDLNVLVGQEFRVGEVRLRGIRLCEPCSYLASKTTEAILPGLAGRGGLRAQILSGGEIKKGDPIRVD